jgi:hypothetical protein
VIVIVLVCLKRNLFYGKSFFEGENVRLSEWILNFSFILIHLKKYYLYDLQNEYLYLQYLIYHINISTIFIYIGILTTTI